MEFTSVDEFIDYCYNAVYKTVYEPIENMVINSSYYSWKLINEFFVELEIPEIDYEDLIDNYRIFLIQFKGLKSQKCILVSDEYKYLALQQPYRLLQKQLCEYDTLLEDDTIYFTGSCCHWTLLEFTLDINYRLISNKLSQLYVDYIKDKFQYYRPLIHSNLLAPRMIDLQALVVGSLYTQYGTRDKGSYVYINWKNYTLEPRHYNFNLTDIKISDRQRLYNSELYNQVLRDIENIPFKTGKVKVVYSIGSEFHDRIPLGTFINPTIKRLHGVLKKMYNVSVQEIRLGDYPKPTTTTNPQNWMYIILN